MTPQFEGASRTADCQHRTRSCQDDLKGGTRPKEPRDARAMMGAQDDEIHATGICWHVESLRHLIYIGEMTVRPKRRHDKPFRHQPTNETATSIMVVPEQRHDPIERRREIRETFHDSKARTIKPSSS